MDITLVNLNMYFVRYLDGMVLRQSQLPLGPLYLISALHQASLTVDFRDYQLLPEKNIFEPEVLHDFLQKPAPIIGISCMANLLPFVLYSMPMLKKAYPQSIFVLGGVGPMAIERQILERVAELDIIHRGEGEISVPLLVKTLKEKRSLENVPNIFYRSKGHIVQNPAAKRIADLASIPWPAYDTVDFSQYFGHNILGSRGCPYPCTFCSIAPIWDWKSYTRPAEDIVREMSHMHQTHGVKEFLFQDEFFIASPKRALSFAAALKKANLHIEYKAFARVDQVDEESLQALAQTGCKEIRFGIESGSDKVLREIQKKLTSDISMRNVALAKRYIKEVDTFFIWGFPTETLEDFSESLFQMIAFRGMGVRVLPSLITYLPQTTMYQEMTDRSKFEFCDFLLPEYMITGVEKRVSVKMEIEEKHIPFFHFIQENQDLFPGFFQYDLKNNILPKLAMLEEFDFYMAYDKISGAHEPTPDQFVMQSR